jgi:hypothetical protein
MAIEFTAQPVIPTNGTFLIYKYIYIYLCIYINIYIHTYIHIYIYFFFIFYAYKTYVYCMGVLLILINPVQFPLHEPYFDLTPIRATHTKITC